MKEYNFDQNYYEHGLCHYFAIEMARLYHCPIYFWLDDVWDSDGNPLTVLCHAFVKLGDGIYVDAYGVFRDISEREDEFEFNTPEPIIEVCNTLEDAYKLLKSLGIPFTNVECKRNAREFLRNNILTLVINYNGYTYNFSLKGYSKQGNSYLCSQYNPKTGIVGDFLSMIPKKGIEKGFVSSFDFVPCKGWYYKKS